jgi:hypothetical protein
LCAISFRNPKYLNDIPTLGMNKSQSPFPGGFGIDLVGLEPTASSVRLILGDVHCIHCLYVVVGCLHNRHIWGQTVYNVHIFHAVLLGLHPVAPGMQQGKATRRILPTIRSLEELLNYQESRRLMSSCMKGEISSIGLTSRCVVIRLALQHIVQY